MRLFPSLALSCVSLLLLSNAALPKEKERQWQTGKVLDANRDKTYVGSVANASGSSTTTGNSASGQVSGSTTAVYRVYETYEIEAGNYVYVCQEHIRWKWSNPAMLTVNGPVQFAIEKDRIYIKSEDGTEHETRIVKNILKTQQPAANPPTPKTQ